VMKWCPGVNCGKVACVSEGDSQQIDCDCGESFCFECAHEWHGPLDCEFLKKWTKQFDSDAQTFRWINENTKDCPKCKAPIQKNGGCNYMRCGKCGHGFCWLCLWPWAQHTQDHFGCNRLNQPTEEKLNREGNDKAKLSIDRYLHYANRFMGQQQSHKLEKKVRETVGQKITYFQNKGFSFIEAQFLNRAFRTLNICRLSLMSTYAFGYYLETDEITRALFEDIQQDLALATEQLSGFLERDLDKVDDFAKLKQTVQDLCRYVERRRNTLVKWSNEGGWKLVDRKPISQELAEVAKTDGS